MVSVTTFVTSVLIKLCNLFLLHHPSLLLPVTEPRQSAAAALPLRLKSVEPLPVQNLLTLNCLNYHDKHQCLF